MSIRGDISRKKILDTSRKLFAAKGFSAVSMQDICDATGLPREAIYIHATHTHTRPFLNYAPADPLEIEYAQTVKRKFADAARMALEDLKPA